jgi:hypothetical protein
MQAKILKRIVEELQRVALWVDRGMTAIGSPQARLLRMYIKWSGKWVFSLHEEAIESWYIHWATFELSYTTTVSVVGTPSISVFNAIHFSDFFTTSNSFCITRHLNKTLVLLQSLKCITQSLPNSATELLIQRISEYAAPLHLVIECSKALLSGKIPHSTPCDSQEQVSVYSLLNNSYSSSFCSFSLIWNYGKLVN